MFERNNGIIIACDVEAIEELRSLVEIARDSSVVVGYKVGFSLALRFGLPAVVSEVKNLTAAPVIYDHQKAGTDIPQMGQPFAACCAESACGWRHSLPAGRPRDHAVVCAGHR